MQFSMILANLKKFSLFLFFSFWLPHPVFCTTLFRNGIFGFVIATLENTVEIRKAFAERRKKEKLTGILEKIFISNSINVGARVWIEILKAIARKISNDQDQAHVVSFISRSIVHIKLKNDGSNRPSLSSMLFSNTAPDFATLTSWEHMQRLEKLLLVSWSRTSSFWRNPNRRLLRQTSTNQGFRGVVGREDWVGFEGMEILTGAQWETGGWKGLVNTRRPLYQRNDIPKLNNQTLSSF